MAYFALIQFEHWDERDVAEWLEGLDDAIHEYIPNFVEAEVDGRKLLMLTHSDLDRLGVTKLGHQELILEGVDLLKSLRYSYESENLQHLALQLGCKARSLHNEILARNGENDQNRANVQPVRHRRQLSISVLSAVCDITFTLKTLTSWLDRAPFEHIHGMTLLRNSIVKLGLELVNVAQKESGITEVENAIVKTCLGMTEYCDELVLNMKESLVVQPASLEIATIRKKQGDELGMNIQSSYYGIHVIGNIKEMSPADLCSKIEKGDEVLQVNNKTVLGWQLAKLVAALKQKPKEVTMLLKKRPRHTTPYGNVPNKRQQSRGHVPSVATLPKTMKKRRSKDGEKPLRPKLEECVTSSVPTGDIYITKESPEDNIDGNDTDNDVFRSGSESPQFTLPVIVDTKQRRATVSGGSPTFERPSLVVEDLDPTPLRPKSQAINMMEKEAAIAAMLMADSSLQRKVADDKHKEKEIKRSLSDSEEIAAENSRFLLENFEGVNSNADEVKQSTTPEVEVKALAKTASTGEGDTSVVSSSIDAVGEGKKLRGRTENDTSTAEKDQEDSEPPDSKVQEFTVTKPTPLVREDSPSGRKSWNQQQKIVSTEVAGNAVRGDQPQLMRIKRLDSQQISELETKMEDDEVFVKPQKRVGFSADTADNEKQGSFTHIVVGGVIQKIPVEPGRNNSNESPTVKMRNKSSMSKIKLDRRVSCKDLGKGDCEGWLYKRKQKDRKLSKHWDKRWCVLKNYSLFYYKNKDELKAEGVIHLPAFQVSPAPQLKTKKHAFKVHNPGTTFYFASERQDDMGKWMNKMGLAAINYDASHHITTSGFSRPEVSSTSSSSTKNGYSESEDEDDQNPVVTSYGSVQSLTSIDSICSQPQTSSPQMIRHPIREVKDIVGASTEDLRSMYTSIRKQDLTIDGKDKVRQRLSQCTASTALTGVANQAEVERLRKLQSLQRTLRAKELELQEIDSLIRKPVSPTELHEFAEKHELAPEPE